MALNIERTNLYQSYKKKGGGGDVLFNQHQ